MNNKEKKQPTLRDEKQYIPFVGAIIERNTDDGKKQVLIQTRIRSSESIYGDCLAILDGKLAAFEDSYEAIRRTIKKETDLDIAFIDGEGARVDYSNRGETSTSINPFCVTQMQEGPTIGITFLCQATEESAVLTSDSNKANWIDIEELRRIINQSPERIDTASLAPLKKYLEAHATNLKTWKLHMNAV